MMNLNISFFATRSLGCRAHGKAFYVLGCVRVLIGFYRIGVFLWNPFDNQTLAVRFGRFKRELNRKQLLRRNRTMCEAIRMTARKPDLARYHSRA